VISRHPGITLLEAADCLTGFDLLLELAVLDSSLNFRYISQEPFFLLYADRTVFCHSLTTDAQDQSFVVRGMSFDPHRRLFLARITGGRLSDHFFESIARLEFGKVAVSFFLGSGHEIVQLPSSQLGDVLWTGHSTIDDDGRSFRKPHSFFKQIKHQGERLPILDIAFKDLVRTRKSFATDYQTYDDLFAVRPVVPRVATLGFGDVIGLVYSIPAGI
jgi:hypothetical protein